MSHSIPQAKPPGGFSLIEVLFALGITTFAFASLFAMFSQGINMVRTQEETMAATSLVQQRLDQIRGGSWATLTNAARLQTAVLGTTGASSARLPGLQEELTISIYRPAIVAGATPIRLRRLSSGVTEILSQPTDAALSACLAVRVDVRATWQSQGRTRVRESSAIVADGGILK